MAKDLTTEVLIVGAGPTGLMAANQLMRFGIDCIIIDKKSGPTVESRAIAITARSLEIYQQLGLAHEAVNGGKKFEYFNLYSKGKQKAEVKIGEIGKGLSEFNFVLAFEQSKNEELLSRNLINNGKSIHWNHEFVKLTEFKNEIKAVVRASNETLTISSKYLIACDGAGSPVRIQLGFSFHGGTYEHKFFVVDALMQWNLGFNKLIICPADQNFCAFLPLKNDRTYRIIGTLPKSYFNRDDITFSDIEKVVIETMEVDIKFESTNWFSIYKLHHRGVEHFRKERVFLAGDSAHIHSPAGGQGMNTGLQDAYNLSWKLAFVLRNQANTTLLDTYNEERLPFAKWLLKFTDRGFNMMTNRNWFIRKFRRYVALQLVGKLLSIELFRPLIFNTVSQLWYSYKGKKLSQLNSRQKLSFTAGDRFPYFSDGDLYPLFTKPSFHLLHIGDQALNSDQLKKIELIFPFTVEVVEDPLSDKWRKLGVKSELHILVRPDNYIGGIFDAIDDLGIRRNLEKHFIYKN
jgi:2-polyprenyl-6-methoxyphenol hydroxylase-like FAD-dependent oxidoreductase